MHELNPRLNGNISYVINVIHTTGNMILILE